MIEVGSFAIFGDWDTTPTPAGKRRIVMPPLGHIFGAGWHPVTQAALLALEQFVQPGQSFAEIGAGSGILSVAAKRLGAGECYATELNPEALAAARKVFACNAVDVHLVEGTFLDFPVDLAVLSISSDFAIANLAQVRATTILVVHDDASIEVVS